MLAGINAGSTAGEAKDNNTAMHLFNLFAAVKAPSTVTIPTTTMFDSLDSRLGASSTTSTTTPQPTTTATTAATTGLSGNAVAGIVGASVFVTAGVGAYMTGIVPWATVAHSSSKLLYA